MRMRVHMAGVLLAAFVAISPQFAHIPGYGISYAEPVPPALLSTARACLAAIDQFMIDGDLQALWQTLDRRGHGLDPWPPTKTSQRDLAALAFRSTFPQARLALATLRPSDEFYVAELDVETGTATRPDWIDSPDAPTLVDHERLIAVDERGEVERADGAAVTWPLTYSASIPDAPSMLTGPSRMYSARITLTPSRRGVRYLSVPAPGIVSPEAGILQVAGEGRLFLLPEGDRRWQQLAANETYLIAPGDLVYLASGYSVLTMTRQTPEQLRYTGIIPDHSSGSEDPDGRSAPNDFTNLIPPKGETAANTWFGQIGPVAGTSGTLADGLTVLEATWIVLPPGETIGILSRAASLAIDVSSSETTSTLEIDDLLISNPGSDAAIVMIVRALPA